MTLPSRREEGNVRAPARVRACLRVSLRTWSRVQVERLWCPVVCRPRSSSNDVAGVVVRSWSTSGQHVFVKSSSSFTFSQYEGSPTGQQLGLVLNLVLLVSLALHVSLVALVSELQVQEIREVLRLICGQLLLRRQVTLVLNGGLVDAVGDLLVDLVRPNLHIVERFLVRDITDCGDVLCFRLSAYTRILN